MTLNSAMTTAVSALKAQSQALSAISNNLSNSSSTGYKSVTTSFKSLVTQAYSGTSFTGAGVTSSVRQNVDSQGSIEGTSNATDMAIDGDGMFIVSDSSGATYYTRNGEFDTDDDGYLYLSGTDYYLMGWPTDSAGNVVGSTTASNLQKVNVTDDVASASATTKVSLDASLGSNTPTVTTTAAASSSISATDAADLTSLGLAAGDTFSVTTSDGTTVTYTVADTDSDGSIELDDLVSTINGTSGNNVTASISSSAPYTLTLTPSDSSTSITAIDDTSGSAAQELGLIDASGAIANATTDSTDATSETSFEAYDSLGNLHTVTATWTHVSSDTSANTNTWTVSFASDDGSTSLSTATLVFDGDGNLTSINGDSSATSLTLGMDWSNAANDSSITLDMSSVSMASADADGVTMTYTKDGYAAGELSGLSIDGDGTVYASYDNGTSKAIAKIAIATFANYDGLEALSSTLYQQTTASGAASLQLAGYGSAGTISASSLEASTVDTADEFTRMIVAQQAYSAASQVITTAKDMFDTLISSVR